jgi:hypothetical protein
MKTDVDLCEIEDLALAIGLHLSEAHLNLRLIWRETLLPSVEAARRLENSCLPASLAAKVRLKEALREFARSLDPAITR